MRRITFLGITLTLALVGTACTPAATATQIPTIAVPITGVTARPAVVITATSPVSEATSTAAVPVVGSPSAEGTQETPGTTPESQTDTSVRIGATTSTGVSEPFLVDQTGRSLYLFTEDTQNSGESACTDDCATNWQPVIVKGIPSAGSGANTGMLGVIPRDDGTMQATYNGWPLYYYSGDRTVGTRNGQGIDNSWFLVSATGNPIQ
jgi:predicted lipoprotein with Yx(FWY)xxD motif